MKHRFPSLFTVFHHFPPFFTVFPIFPVFHGPCGELVSAVAMSLQAWVCPVAFSHVGGGGVDESGPYENPREPTAFTYTQRYARAHAHTS